MVPEIIGRAIAPRGGDEPAGAPWAAVHKLFLSMFNRLKAIENLGAEGRLAALESRRAEVRDATKRDIAELRGAVKSLEHRSDAGRAALRGEINAIGKRLDLLGAQVVALQGRAVTKTVEHVRDPETGEIVRSVIVEKEAGVST